MSALTRPGANAVPHDESPASGLRPPAYELPAHDRTVPAKLREAPR